MSERAASFLAALFLSLLSNLILLSAIGMLLALFEF